MKKCPKCKNMMVETEKNGITVDKCIKCDGLFLEFMELEKFIDSVDEQANNKTIEDVEKGEFRADHQGRNYECAGCNSEMDEREFNYGSGIHIDFCKSCGATFLGVGELKEILDYEYSRIHSVKGKMIQKQFEQMGQKISREQSRNTSYINDRPLIMRLFHKFSG